jgi:MFS family permease
MCSGYFHGWTVVGVTFVMALWSFGLGFYGVAAYLAALQRLHEWAASTVSAPVTAYYVAGALVTAASGDLYERFGPRAVLVVGSVALAAGVATLGILDAPWQLYPAFLVMSIGWGAMSGAAINVILAPWWERRRGLAVSLAFNGATLGGVVVAPGLILLIELIGFARALTVAASAHLVVMLAVTTMLRWRSPDALGVGPDGGPPRRAPDPPPAATERRWRGDALRTWRFWSVSAPFALGLAAQVGVLTHLGALVAPELGAGGAARALGTATAAALAGRLATGLVVDRVNRRVVASATLAVQIVGLALLARGRSPAEVYAGCVAFGLGVGNLTTLPGLILAVEWPRERFSALVSLMVGINQLTFALGPSLVGVIRDWAGAYGPALAACATLQMIAAVTILLGPGHARSPGRRSP